MRRSPSLVMNSRRGRTPRPRRSARAAARVARQKIGDDVFVLLRLAASRCNRPACRRAWSAPTARSIKRRCSAGEPDDVGRSLEPGHVGMAADGAGRRARRIEQHGVERAPALPFRDIGADDLGGKRQPRQIVRQPRQPRRRAVDGGDERAGGGKLRRLAARRRAEIGDAAAGMSPRRRAGSAAAASCTHHAPSAKPGSAVTAPCAMVRTEPVGSTRPPSFAAQNSGSLFTVRSSAGFVAVRRGDGVRGRGAISRGPSRHQPVGRVEIRQYRARQARSAPSRATRRSTALTRPAKRAASRSA